jgi:hypothetical protein
VVRQPQQGGWAAFRSLPVAAQVRSMIAVVVFVVLVVVAVATDPALPSSSGRAGASTTRADQEQR